MSSDHFKIPKKIVYWLVAIFIVAFLGLFLYPSTRIRLEPFLFPSEHVMATPESAPARPTPFAPPELVLFRCEDLYQKLCRSPKKNDASGRVAAPYEGEAGVLRIFERLIRKNPDMNPNQIDELLAAQIYTPQKTKILRDLFENIRDKMISFFEDTEHVSAEQVTQLKTTLQQVKLELPPPAAIYADEPDLLTLDNAYYYRSTDGVQKIRIGGAQVYGVSSRYNLAFTLAHELAHAVGPCEVEKMGFRFPDYDTFTSCIGYDPTRIHEWCEKKTQLPEVFADWVGTQITAEIIDDDFKSIQSLGSRAAIFNAVRDLCPDDGDESEGDDINNLDQDLTALHPTAEFRINGIFSKSPIIQKLVGCVPRLQETSYGISSRCYQQ